MNGAPGGPEGPQSGQSGRLPDSWDSWAEIPLDGDERSRVPLFLGREIYRRRRIMDAARLLPAFGTALLMLPMLWAPDHGTAAGAVYTFLVWFLLIIIAALLAHRLSEPLRKSDNPPGTDGGEH
ncbi:hypothetical protein [Aliiruegeria lutimaris]|uniref:Uncharacterized protein n=1 Tax=Aliiruegeria lutimaris TaxID=571298 RepID=A0A1G8WRC0_9RHOB|nr:hypothetical protein [Aliiruegeria lutimaris]SDJ80150.1 hypothetical protein SAMN04488026_102454 [Aliiruegeria lutimaris]